MGTLGRFSLSDVKDEIFRGMSGHWILSHVAVFRDQGDPPLDLQTQYKDQDPPGAHMRNMRRQAVDLSVGIGRSFCLEGSVDRLGRIGVSLQSSITIVDRQIDRSDGIHFDVLHAFPHCTTGNYGARRSTLDLPFFQMEINK